MMSGRSLRTLESETIQEGVNVHLRVLYSSRRVCLGSGSKMLLEIYNECSNTYGIANGMVCLWYVHVSTTKQRSQIILNLLYVDL